jgi:hypothetical protein
MFDRENTIGWIMLALCVGIGGLLIYSIVTGERLRYTGPTWLAYLLMAIFIGGALYGLITSLRGRWPDPMTGRGRRWPWSRDRSSKK